MSPETLNIVIASIIAPLLGVVIGFMVWSQRRMDKKDERYTEQSEARAKENLEERQTFVDLANRFVLTTEDRADKFYKTAHAFNETAVEFTKTIQDVVSPVCKSIDELVLMQAKWREEWQKWEEGNEAAVGFLMGDFLDGVKEEHQQLLNQRDTLRDFMGHVKDEHEEMVRALRKMCIALDVKINGSGVWDGVERREGDECRPGDTD